MPKRITIIQINDWILIWESKIIEMNDIPDAHKTAFFWPILSVSLPPVIPPSMIPMPQAVVTKPAVERLILNWSWRNGLTIWFAAFMIKEYRAPRIPNVIIERFPNALKACHSNWRSIDLSGSLTIRTNGNGIKVRIAKL